jgi:uncharacterized repeat protein (TIGR03803 family)
MTGSLRFVLPSLALGVCVAADAGLGQTYEVLHSFAAPGGQPSAAVLASPSGVLYGTTQSGGVFARGSIYSLTPNGSGGFDDSLLYSFTGPEGAAPFRALAFGPDGSLYGTTHAGGAAGVGVLFRFTPSSGAFTRLHDFADGGGQDPTELLLASDGSFYGTATAGGAHGGGTVFRLGSDESFATVHDFDGATEGSVPVGGLLQVGAFLYGTTRDGGTGGHGTVFRIDLAGNFTTLHSFVDADGSAPLAALIAGSDGNLYGTTAEGGAGGQGTVFRMDPSGTVTTLHSFQGQDGAAPDAPLFLASDGKYYGTTAGGGPGGGKDYFPAGTVFRIDGLGNFELRATFAAGILGTASYTPIAPLTDGHDGFLYGTTYGPLGAVFRLDPSDGFAFEYFFGSDGGLYGPGGRLTEVNGALYGVTGGAIYRLDGSEATVVHAFAPQEGSGPSSLLLGSDGSLYGTMYSAGPFLWGSVFRFTLPDTFEVLHEFNFDDGANPLGGVVEGPAGEFYGTTSRGGIGLGTVFHIDTSGTLTTVHSFAEGFLEGSDPTAAPVRTADGSLYGPATLGGPNAWGDLYAIDPLGSLSVFHAFNASDGCCPPGPLVQGTDGAFYGGSPQNAANELGNLFRIDLAGNFTSIHDFAGPEGAGSNGALLQAPDGLLYGGANGGGSAGQGTLFRVDTQGKSFEVLHDLQGNDGVGPGGGLMRASDGAFYGAAGGGFAGGGVVFRLAPGSLVPALSAITPSSGRAAGGTAITVVGDHLFGVSGVSIGGASTPLAVPDQARVFTVSPTLAPGTLNDVTVEVATSRPRGAAQTLPAAWLADFSDVSDGDIFHAYVETIFRDGITAGCGAGAYCRDAAVRRDQMAVFLLKAEHGSAYAPPPCQQIFADVPCPGPFVDWIEQLAAEGVTAGCGGGDYCPGAPVTRAQMAVFLLKAKEGSSYTPPPAAGIFDDVPPSDSFAPWIEELANRQITGGCQISPPLFCPANPNTRGQMAVFLVKTFGL